MTFAASTMTPPYFRSVEVCRLAGVSYRQLDYWDRIGLISPTRQAEGSGSARGYTPDDVLLVKLIGILAGQGMRVSMTREVLDLVRPRLPFPIPVEACIVLPYDGAPLIVDDPRGILAALGTKGGGVLPIAVLLDL